MRRDNYHTWTAADYELLDSMYDGTTDSLKRAATKIGTTYDACRKIASRRGLLRVYYDRYSFWTAEDDALLHSNAGSCDANELSIMLRRSVGAVRRRAQRLGLSLALRRDSYCLQEAATILGVNLKWLHKKVLSGALKANRGSDGLGGPYSEWYIERDDLRRFVCQHPLALQGRIVDMVALVDLLAGVEYT